MKMFEYMLDVWKCNEWEYLKVYSFRIKCCRFLFIFCWYETCLHSVSYSSCFHLWNSLYALSPARWHWIPRGNDLRRRSRHWHAGIRAERSRSPMCRASEVLLQFVRLSSIAKIARAFGALRSGRSPTDTSYQKRPHVEIKRSTLHGKRPPLGSFESTPPGSAVTVIFEGLFVTVMANSGTDKLWFWFVARFRCCCSRYGRCCEVLTLELQGI